MGEWAIYRRLEPTQPLGDMALGIAAQVADPAWLLGRQWQLGEHQGEDASSPVDFRAEVSHTPIVYDGRRPDLDPTVVPAEALVEADPDDWWTVGRRIRLGRAAAPLLAALDPPMRPAQRQAFTFGQLPEPYAALAGELDGLAAFRSGLLAGQALWAEVPSPMPDRWQPRGLVYQAAFTAGGAGLVLERHGGGDLDWYSVDGTGDLSPPPETRHTRSIIPGRLRYPGAPHPRWWQIEDHAVDIGGFGPDRSHVPTALFLDVSLAHSDDWFTVAVPTPREYDAPSVGVVLTLHDAKVRDSFDEWWPLTVPPGRGDAMAPGMRPWSLYRTRGLDRSSLVIWPVVATPITSEPLDEIVLGVDEDANLLWAVELRADGIPLAPDSESLKALAEVTPTGTRRFRYLPSSTLPPHWHPYRIEARGAGMARTFVQGLVADLTQPLAPPRAGPRSRVIGGPSYGGPGRGHELEPTAVPSLGLKLERRWVLGRRTDGAPALWVERRRMPFAAPPVSSLRFDVLAEAPAQGEDGHA